jgi:hypothetical protein
MVRVSHISWAAIFAMLSQSAIGPFTSPKAWEWSLSTSSSVIGRSGSVENRRCGSCNVPFGSILCYTENHEEVNKGDTEEEARPPGDGP